jgi:hypothetical protein
VERMLSNATKSSAIDTLERLQTTEMVERAVVVTDDASGLDGLGEHGAEVDCDSPREQFHFGSRLAGLVRRWRADRVLYCGAGAAPLMQAEDWAKVCSMLCGARNVVVSNNYHSSDWVGFSASEDITDAVAQEGTDNALAWSLSQRCGLVHLAPAVSAATRFDLDTPTDLSIAWRHPNTGPRLRRFLEDGLGWQLPQLEAVLDVLRGEGTTVTLIGRVSTAALSCLEDATQCWTRVYAEERGMRAAGRQARGLARSLVADHITAIGVDAFWLEMGELADAVLCDSRVLLAARQSWPAAADRYSSDLLDWGAVEDPFLRDFTRCAREAELPVVLGGHSVVAGGLLALLECLRAEPVPPATMRR